MIPMYTDGQQLFVPRRVAAHLLGDGRRLLVKRASIEKLAEV